MNEKALVDLKASAVEFGFDATWITDLVSKFGGDVLSLVVEAVRGGFSKELVIEVLEKFGPFVLELLVNLLNKQKMAAAFGADVSADKFGLIDISIIESLVQKYLPVLLEKYGNQIAQIIINWVVTYLKSLTENN